MPNKTQEYLNLAQQTAKELTRYWENWTDYLTTASRLYKYSYADQLMIYAQRPDATACASFNLWNNRMNRYVRHGSKGIALLDQSSSVPRLHYVFDVSDTGVRRNSRDPEVWQLGPDLVQPVSEMLAREYGVRHERITQQIADICGKLVDSYWDNNSGDILDIVDGSFLMDYDEAGQEFQFKSAAAISITYAVLERCGFEPEGHFDRDDFQAIFSFSTPAAVYALGTAVSECSRDVLRNIERTVKTTIRRRNVERSQYEYEQQERDLLDHRGLSAPEPDPAPAGENTGQVRATAPDLPDEASPGAVQLDSEEYRGWFPLFTVMLGTGCRIGEVLGLRWQDVDFKNRTISINHNLVYRVQEDGTCTNHVNSPKTKAGIRIIPMIDEVFDAFLEEYQYQKVIGFCTDEIDGYSGFVFCTGDGKVYLPNAINRTIRSICADYNKEEESKAKEENRDPVLLPKFSCHILRHTFCTRFCENETNLKVIQEIMGHADISTTMDVYAEATQEKKKESMASLQSALLVR